MAKKSSDNRKKQAKSEEQETVDLAIEDAEVVTEASAEDADVIEEETAEESTAAAHDDVPENVNTEVENIAEADSYEETLAVQPVEKRQNTFIPLVFGGLVAGQHCYLRYAEQSCG